MTRSLTHNQVVLFMKQVNVHGLRLTMACTLMLEAGLRLGEVRKLTWFDLIYLNIPRTSIEISKQISKNGESRLLPVSPTLHCIIASIWLNTKKESYITEQDLVLAHRHLGKGMSARTLQRNIKDIGWITVARVVTPHMLRHTFATHLLSVSNLEIVRQALGHKRISTTQIYVHPTDDEIRNAINKKNETQD